MNGYVMCIEAYLAHCLPCLVNVLFFRPIFYEHILLPRYYDMLLDVLTQELWDTNKLLVYSRAYKHCKWQK